MSVFLDNERPLVTLPVRWGWLKQPTSDTEDWRGKARRRSTSHFLIEHTHRHLDMLTNSADKQSCGQTLQIDASGTYIFIKKKKEWKTAEVLQKCSLLLAIAGLKTHLKCCFLLFIFVCQRTTVLWDEPGTQKQHMRSSSSFFVQRVGSHLHLSLRSPLPARREPVKHAPGVRSTGSTGRTIKRGEIIPSYLSITAPLSQIYRSVQAARGGRWLPNIANHGIRPAQDLLMCLNRAAERSNADCLFCDWRVFKGAFGWGEVFHCLEACLGHNCPSTSIYLLPPLVRRMCRLFWFFFSGSSITCDIVSREQLQRPPSPDTLLCLGCFSTIILTEKDPTRASK